MGNLVTKASKAEGQQRRVLVAGLGRYAGADPSAAEKFGPQQINRQLAADSLEQAREAGFDCSSIDVNPDDPEASLAEIKQRLSGKRYDAFIIGYGLRGNKGFTPLFERIVNLSVEINPKTRFAFSTAPDAVVDAILRVPPQEAGVHSEEQRRKFWQR